MKKNLIAVLIGITLSVFFLGALEVYYRVFVPPQRDPFTFVLGPRAEAPEAHLSEEFIEQIHGDPVMNWSLSALSSDFKFLGGELDTTEKGRIGCCVLNEGFALPGVVRSRVYSKKRDLLYDVKFTFDQLGRRITPVVNHPRKSLLAFGDSYTLGEGVNDEESFPFVLGTYRPTTQVYNLGLMGGSPNQTLYEVTKLSNKRLPDLPDQEVTAVYTFMSDHLERLICRSLCLTELGQWRLNQPYYSLREGRPFFEGAFYDRKVLNSIYTWFNKSAIVQGAGLVLPPRFSQEHFDFFATVMAEIHDSLRSKYPRLNFYVVMYPGDSDPYADQVAEAVRKKGLKVLNYASIDIRTLSQKREKIGGDGHPSPIAHMIFARLLDRDLPQ